MPISRQPGPNFLLRFPSRMPRNSMPYGTFIPGIKASGELRAHSEVHRQERRDRPVIRSFVRLFVCDSDGLCQLCERVSTPTPPSRRHKQTRLAKGGGGGPRHRFERVFRPSRHSGAERRVSNQEGARGAGSEQASRGVSTPTTLCSSQDELLQHVAFVTSFLGSPPLSLLPAPPSPTAPQLPPHPTPIPR